MASIIDKFHNWLRFRLPSDLSNLWKSSTGSGLTDADKEANEMSLQNAEEIWQRNVDGMRKAGINPALMYGSGVSSSAPEAPNPQQGASMSDLMSLMMVPAQTSLLKAQASDMRASADLKRVQADESVARTENIRLVNAYYPRVTETSLAEASSRIGLNLSNVARNDMETALAESKKVLQDKENEYASRFFKARAEFEEAKTEEAKASAAKQGAEALLAAYENEYARANGAKLSSSSALAIVSALLSHFGELSPESISAVRDTFKPFGLLDNTFTRRAGGTVENTVNDVTSKGRRFVSRSWKKFKGWIKSNNPRRYEKGSRFWD